MTTRSPFGNVAFMIEESVGDVAVGVAVGWGEAGAAAQASEDEARIDAAKSVKRDMRNQGVGMKPPTART